MRVPEGFDFDFKKFFPGGDFLTCENKNDARGVPFDFVSTAIIEKLLTDHLIRCRIEVDTSHAHYGFLVCELEKQGQEYHLKTQPLSINVYLTDRQNWQDSDYIRAQHNNGMHPTRDTHDFMFQQRLGRAGDAGRQALTFLARQLK